MLCVSALQLAWRLGMMLPSVAVDSGNREGNYSKGRVRIRIRGFLRVHQRPYYSVFSKFYANEKANPVNGRPAQLSSIVNGFGLNDGIEEKYTITKETVYENLMVLQVLFTSIQESNYKEYVKYDYTQLIGDVGGQMGMLLGASLFTIIEFIHFFIKAGWRYCVKRAARRAGEGGAEQPAYEMHRDQADE
eukprot:sb/3471173/